MESVFYDAQSRGEYLSGYRIFAGEDGHVLYVGEAEKEEECGGLTPFPQNDGDIIDVFSPAGSS